MKRKLLGILLGTTLVIGLAACGGGDDAADDSASGDNGGATTANAEDIFQQNCSACHGKDLKGGVGPDLTKVGSKYSKDEIYDIIENGRGAMRAGIIDGDEQEAVATWLSEKK